MPQNDSLGKLPTEQREKRTKLLLHYAPEMYQSSMKYNE